MRKRRFGMGLWLLATAMLCFFENNAGTRAIFLASVLVPLLCIVCAAAAAKRARVLLDGPQRSGEEEEICFSCVLSGSWLLALCTAKYTIIANHRMNGKTEKITCRTEKCTLRIDTSLCGAIDIAVSDAAVCDALGLCAFPVRAEAQARLTVLPELYPVRLSVSSLPEQRSDTSAYAVLGRGAEEIIGMREYRPGDSIRMIHWKLSEKLDRTMLRETGSPEDAQIVLLLNAERREETGAQEIADCAKAFLSTACALLGEGMSFEACLPQKEKMLRLSIFDEADFDELQDAVLSLLYEQRGESVGRTFAAQCPELLDERVVLFSPCAETEAASLYAGHPVTLVLPESVGAYAGGTEIRVCALSKEENELDI